MHRLAPQQPRAQRMKRRNPRPLWRHTSPQQQIAHASLHLLSRLVRERHRQNRVRRRSLGNQIRHPKRNRARLSRPGASQYQHRPFRSFRSQTLFRIQFFQQVFHGVRGNQNSFRSTMLADAATPGKSANFPRVAATFRWPRSLSLAEPKSNPLLSPSATTRSSNPRIETPSALHTNPREQDSTKYTKPRN